MALSLRPWCPLAVLVVLVLASAWPVAARAQQSPPRPEAVSISGPTEEPETGSSTDVAPRAPELTVGLELAASHVRLSEERVAFTLSPLLYGHSSPIPEVEIRATVPLAAGWVRDASDGQEEGFRLGNPFIGVAYRWFEGPTTVLWGGGVLLPIADAEPGPGRGALAYGAAMRGYRRAWLWNPDLGSLGLVWDARLRFETSRWFLGVDTAFSYVREEQEGTMVVGVTLDDETRTRSVMYFDVAAEARYEVVPTVSAGLGLAAALSAPPAFGGYPPGGDQLSADLIVLWRPTPAFFELRFTTNLDEPAGLSFDDQGIWGARLRGGVSL